tara:strand:- start:630 stop:1052 length:423 start_codon:yes stop_codon:yes gene_type:complete
MNKQMKDSDNLTTRTQTHTIHLAFWTGTWVLSTAVTAYGPKLLWNFNSLLSIVGVLIHLGIGFGMILANKRYLNAVDELMRKIQIEAMAVTLGVGLVVGISYELVEDIKLISFEPEISHLIILMAFTYCIGIILGNRRYQ